MNEESLFAAAIELPPGAEREAFLDKSCRNDMALAVHDSAKAKLVELRFFAGMTLPEAAAALGISPSTADRSWKYARAWLYAAMDESSEKK